MSSLRVMLIQSLLLTCLMAWPSCSDATSPQAADTPRDAGARAQIAEPSRMMQMEPARMPETTTMAVPRAGAGGTTPAKADTTPMLMDAGTARDAAPPRQPEAPKQPDSEDAGPSNNQTPLVDNPADVQGTSTELVKRMAPGWNLGNSLDSCSMVASELVDETTWGNPRIEESLFLALKRDGMRSVRIPITWRHHVGPAPEYQIDAAFMDRVQQVVDYAVRNDLYAIINLHHDGGGDPEGGAWIRNAATDYSGTLAKFLAVWRQIAARFQAYPHRLLFEAMNEVGFDTLEKSEGYARLNMLNQAFVDLIRQSGGNNATRHLLYAGYWTDFAESSMGTKVPNDPARRSILSVHYYTPWMFCVNGDPMTWGTAQELAELQSKFQLLKTTFTDRGEAVIMGEYGVNIKAERASRVFWIEHATKAAFDLGIAPMFWDNGEEVDRATNMWRTPGLMEALLRATSGRDYEIVKQP